MAPSLTDFKKGFRDRLLDMLWRQWTAMGIAGQVAPQDGVVIDPEALLLLSCTVGRHDPRLFDAILDWLRINGRYLNIARLQRMLKEFPFSGGRVYAAAAASISTSQQKIKWNSKPGKERFENLETLFFMENGNPLPVVREPDPVFMSHGLLRDPYEPRNTAHRFRADLEANLLLRLRAFLGVHARCEILAFLMLNGRGSPRAMAKACVFYPATAARALAEMDASGLLIARVEGRHRFYSLASEGLRTLFLGKSRPAWINWAPLFAALEQAWHFLDACGRKPRSPLAQASDLRRLLKASLMPLLAAGGPTIPVGDHDRFPGEALIPFFQDQLGAVFDSLQKQP